MARPIQDETQMNDDHDAIVIPNAFQINSEDTANWLVRKIVEARQYREKVKEWADREINRSERDERWLLVRFGPQLQGWLQSWLQHNGGRRRSINLPAGIVGFRTEPSRLIIIDENALSRWCRRHLVDALQVRAVANGAAAVDLEGSLQGLGPGVKCEASISKSVINDFFVSCGELPDGMNVAPRSDVLYIR